MASKGKNNKTSVLNAFAKAGYGDLFKEKKTKLWDTDNAEEIIEDVLEADCEVSLYMGTTYNSFFVILREGDMSSDPISFITGAIDSDDVTLNEDDLNDSETAYDISDIPAFLEELDMEGIRVIEVEALRDDTDLENPVAKGDKVLRAELI